MKKGIVLIGKMGSGKTNISDFLQSKKYVKFSMATWLKDTTYDISTKSKNEKIIIGDKEYTKRRLYQYFGTDVIRNFDNDFHVRRLLLNINSYRAIHPFNKFVIDDVRFPNEIELIKTNYNITAIKLVCPEEIRKQRLIYRDGGYDENDFNHVSETNIDNLPCDYTIDTNIPEEDVIKIVKQIIKIKQRSNK
jgi:dephospho-CoA kinase